ncbi:RDD family protein [Lutibacter sp.]
MDNFHIETAQNVTIQQNVASLYSRIGAFLLDLLIIVAYYMLIMLIIMALDYKPTESIYVFYALLSLPVFFYSLLFETLMNGQTPGKYVSKIRVVKIDGSKPTFGSYLIRWVLRIIDISLASGSVAILTILLNGKGQRLGDLAAGTTVISELKKITINDTLLVDIPEEYTPTFPQVTLLNDKDIQTIKQLYLTAKRRGNRKTILKLHTKIIEITGITTEMKPSNFIDVVLKDYNYFTQQM